MTMSTRHGGRYRVIGGLEVGYGCPAGLRVDTSSGALLYVMSGSSFGERPVI